MFPGHGGVGGSRNTPLTGDPTARRLGVMKRRYVSMVQEGSMPEMHQSLEGCNGRAASVSLAKIVL